MNIVITVDPEIPVPPKLYGGIERIADFLIKGLIKKGHQVTLFAHRDSNVDCNFIPYPGLTSRSKMDVFKNIWTVSAEIPQNADIIHSFGRIAYLAFHLPKRIPKIMSYQREPSLKMVRQAMLLARKNTLAFTGCSNYISDQIKPFAPAYTVYNGVPAETYSFSENVKSNAPLVFLGRIEHIKGAHTAIEIALKTGRQLIIAGNIPGDAQSQEYFNSKIKPFIDGKQINYVGPVNDTQKNELLGQAAAFLMPIHWNEPFGIVMAEAMACGTPLIGFNRGSVPEVVRHGLNGFVCNDTDSMIDSVKNISMISRKNVYDDFLNRFSADVIVENYINLYKNRIGGLRD